MVVLLVIVALTLMISGSCSLFESVLYSSRTGTLEAAKRRPETERSAAQMLDLKKSISQPIAAILILNTIANTAGATLAGAYAGALLPTWLVPVFSVLFTLAILFLAEIMPKTIGALRWRRIWPSVVLPLQLMKIGLRPFIFVTEKFTSLFSHGQKVPLVTEDEILAMVHIGTREGEISKEEGNIVRNLIQLEERQVREIMTPRTVIFSLDAELTVREAAEIIEGKGFSRIPVFKGEKENISGYVLSQEITSARVQAQPGEKLKTIVKPITFVRDDTNCLILLSGFLKHRRHLAIVTDEFNGIDGLVTLEDLLETMLGTEIVDESDQAVDWQEVARKRGPRSGPAKEPQ